MSALLQQQVQLLNKMAEATLGALELVQQEIAKIREENRGLTNLVAERARASIAAELVISSLLAALEEHGQGEIIQQVMATAGEMLDRSGNDTEEIHASLDRIGDAAAALSAGGLRKT